MGLWPKWTFHFDGRTWVQEQDMPMNCVVELYDNIIMVGGATGLYVLSKEQGEDSRIVLNKVWLTTQDKLDHATSYQISVRVDNTLPKVEIRPPDNGF